MLTLTVISLRYFHFPTRIRYILVFAPDWTDCSNKQPPDWTRDVSLTQGAGFIGKTDGGRSLMQAFSDPLELFFVNSAHIYHHNSSKVGSLLEGLCLFS